MASESPPLFRKIAIEAAAGTQIGEPLVTHWRGIKIFTGIACSVVATLMVFAATVEYAPIHRVPCYTDVRNGLARLAAPIGGQITRILVTEGSVVHTGELLAVLSNDVLRSDGSTQNVELQRQLAAEQIMIEHEIAAMTEAAAATGAMIDRRIAGLRLERVALRAELDSHELLLRSLRGQTDKLANLRAQGYATELQLLQRHDDFTLQEGRVAAARAALTRVHREIETSEAERRVVEANRAAAIESRHRESGELARLTVQSDAQSEQAIRAPVDGVISTAALIAQGQSVARGQALFTIVPTDEPLVVRLLVPVRAAAAVQPDVEIRVVFRAYPQEKFGDYPARIVSVSELAWLPADIAQIFAASEPAFIALAILPRDLHTPDGQPLKLKPGMLADALVPIERRTIAEWLSAPILRGFNESAGRVATP